jgi:hypothetical protein
MSMPPLVAPSARNVIRSPRLNERVFLVGTLLINAILALQIVHVLRWPAYLPSARFHFVLVLALAVNLITAAARIALSPDDGRIRSQSLLWLCDWAICLLILAMVRAWRIPSPEHMQRVFGMIYAAFVYSRLMILAGWVSLFRCRTRPVLRAAVFLASFIVYFAITPWVAATATTNGDEPHYLLLSHSLLHDHDFDLRNNYDHHDDAIFYWYNLSARHIVTNQRGQQMPFHDVGLSVILVPGYAIGNRLGAMIEINLFAAILAAGMVDLALELGASVAGAISCWALFAFVSPMITFAAQIYPEIPGAALSIWAAIFFARFMETRDPVAMPVVGCMLAIMPWLSVRFWVVLAPMVLVIALYLVFSFRW